MCTSTRVGNPLYLFRTRALALRVSLALAVLTSPATYGTDMPTAEEMQQMQKEMQEGMGVLQQEMEKLDPATRQQLDQLMSSPPTTATADSGGMPTRNTAKISAISTAALNANDLKRHVDVVISKLATALTPTALERAERVDAEIHKSSDYLAYLRAAANGLAAWGAWPEATYLMGKAAKASGSAQDLNNLAALLTMQHAETAALPILYTLNARYPNNSTLLNNIGQARYGLGDIEDAEKFFIAAVRITPLHPQANATHARIHSARGDKQAAEAAVHAALEGGFSTAKEEQLRKTGGKLRHNDVRWHRPMPQDPLGLEKFTLPAYPTQARDLPAATPIWKAFRESTQALAVSLEEQSRATQGDNSMGAALTAAIAVTTSPYALKASMLMGFESEQYRIGFDRRIATTTEAMLADTTAFQELKQQVAAIDAAGTIKYRDVPGGYGVEYTCDQVVPLVDAYIKKTNAVYEELQQESLRRERKHINDMTYLAQYTLTDPVTFEAAKLSAKAGFARQLSNMRVALEEGFLSQRIVCLKDAKVGKSSAKLPDFDDFHCDYVSTLDIPGVGTIVSRCNVLEANFNPIFAPIQASWATDVAKDRVLRASASVSVDAVTVGGHSEFDGDGLATGGVNVGVSTDLGPKVKGGPLQIGIEAGVTAGLEFDRNGITDVSINTGIESKTSSSIGKTDMAGSKSTLKAGADATWSWNAGYSGDASGGFKSSVF